MFDKPHLTHEECFRLTGTLGEARSLRLIDLAEHIEEVGNAVNYLSDAGFGPDEDFLTYVIDRLTVLKGRVRGENKEELEGILLMLSDIQTECQQGTEHTKEQIGKAIEALEKIQ